MKNGDLTYYQMEVLRRANLKDMKAVIIREPSEYQYSEIIDLIEKGLLDPGRACERYVTVKSTDLARTGRVFCDVS